MNLTDRRRQLEILWQTVFHDSDEYVRMFFDRVYQPENTFVIEQEGRGVVAMLQAVPYLPSCLVHMCAGSVRILRNGAKGT